MATEAVNLEYTDELGDAEAQLALDLGVLERRLAAAVALGESTVPKLRAERDQAAGRLDALRTERQRRADEAARRAAEEAERIRTEREAARREAVAAYDQALAELVAAVDVAAVRERIALLMAAGAAAGRAEAAADGFVRHGEQQAMDVITQWVVFTLRDVGLAHLAPANVSTFGRPEWLPAPA
jgi:hypothetical protein